jgi:hypothetical protein
MASCNADGADTEAEQHLQPSGTTEEPGNGFPERPGHSNEADHGRRDPTGDSHAAIPKPAEPQVSRGKKRGSPGNDPVIAKIVLLRERRDKMKQEAKKLSSEVKIENRRRVRLGRLADKLSDTDLCNLLQQRGLNTGGTGSQSTSRPNDIRK